MNQTLAGILPLRIIAYAVLWYIQFCLGIGTAYRFTKRGSDNGVALFGWILLFSLAAYIPGLGLWLWRKYRIDENQLSVLRSRGSKQPVPPSFLHSQSSNQPAPQRENSLSNLCRKCGNMLPADGDYCEHCGTRFT